MSTINSLTIQGIRSYPTDEPTTVKFFKPLTLIVGSNGSGKTVKIKAYPIISIQFNLILFLTDHNRMPKVLTHRINSTKHCGERVHLRPKAK